MNSTILQVTALMVVGLTVGAAQDREKKISRSQLPPAVEQTVGEQSKGATVRGFSREREGGKTYYEAQLKVNGHTKDVLIDADGKVVEVEEEAPAQELPPAVLNGLKSEAKGGTLGKVESLTKNGKLVAYEAVVITEGKKSEVQVGPTGGPLDHPE